MNYHGGINHVRFRKELDAIIDRARAEARALIRDDDESYALVIVGAMSVTPEEMPAMRVTCSRKGVDYNTGMTLLGQCAAAAGFAAEAFTDEQARTFEGIDDELAHRTAGAYAWTAHLLRMERVRGNLNSMFNDRSTESDHDE